MSEKGYEPDIERRRFNVAEVPIPEVRCSATATAFWHLDAGGGAVHSIMNGPQAPAIRTLR